ncbi:MAG: HAD family hydrolase [Gammaproteobacteria bacterium]|nr:HAD family hydrolase [Gammaproteobacteria bacterium]
MALISCTCYLQHIDYPSQHFKTVNSLMINGICFDLFHTLVDVGSVPMHIGRYTADILGLDRDEWNRACFSQAHIITEKTDHFHSVKNLAHSIKPSIPESLIETAVMERQNRFNHALMNIEPGITETLQQLRQLGIKLALVSNASSGEVKAWPASPLAQLFDSAIFSCDVGARKPEKEIYHAALNDLQLNAEQCLFVGDGGSNEHHGARQVGLQPVLITRYLHSAVKMEQQRELVEWEIETIPQILPLLKTINGQ